VDNRYLLKVAEAIEKQSGLLDIGRTVLSKGKQLAGKAMDSVKSNATKLKGDIGNLGKATGVGGKTSVLKAIGKNPIVYGGGGLAAGMAAKKLIRGGKDKDGDK
jgi:hypothetical protein